MTRHPDNPFWCAVHDNPKSIARHEWDDAVAAGFVTPEHLAARVRGMLSHAMDIAGAAGYDADGFMISLTAAGFRMSDRIRIDVRSHDHDPPHAHIVVKGEPGLDVRVNLETATLIDAMPAGMAKLGRRIEAFVAENRVTMLGTWATYRASDLEP